MQDAIGLLETKGLVALVEEDKTESFAQTVLEQYQSKTGITAQVYPGLAADGAGVLSF